MTQINVYLIGNRIRAEIGFAVDVTATDPTSATFTWKNLDTETSKVWRYAPPAADVLPTQVNAEFEHPATGSFVIEFDCDAAGEQVIRAEGTGACKAAGEKKFQIQASALT